MKEVYAWVPWFEALGRKIDEGGEAYLVECAKKVNWGGGDPALLKYGDEFIDPFSFFYFLAQKNTVNQRQHVYASVSEVFGIDGGDLLSENSREYGFIFPTPSPNTMALFHDGESPNTDLLWRLFRHALNGDHLESSDFSEALSIKFVKVTKLTQCLFLVNPHRFMPIDAGILRYHVGLSLPSYDSACKKISKNSFTEYNSILNGFCAAFPGCDFYEVNTALYLLGKWESTDKRFFQVSTNVFNDDEDYWEEFRENCHVRTGGPGSGSGFDSQEIDKSYPIRQPVRGEIILVRYKSEGRAIGVVFKNDYSEEGLHEDNAIHVLWLNKTRFEGNFSRQKGFTEAHDSGSGSVYNVFRSVEAYQSTFNLIRHIHGDSDEHKESLSNRSNQMTHPLNQILFGPPGTGKTWNTVNHALAIIEGAPVEDIERENRAQVMERFEKLKESGQVAMVTFHQSFSYEDFIEGIRPVLDDDSGSVKYEIVDGIFKQIANRARANIGDSSQETRTLDLDVLLQDFAQYINSKLDQDETVRLSDNPKYSHQIIDAKIRNNGNVQFTLDSKKRAKPFVVSSKIIRRDYHDFLDGKIENYRDIKPTYASKSGYHGDGIYLCDLMRLIKKYQDNEWQTVNKYVQEKQNYVLIIDEINRGNIAKIFGELITLIEPSKRLAGEDAVTVTLPYSKDEVETFGVPDNLYIIGTMNTADRSIALLDTALRRRFEFVEMMPQPNHDGISDNIDGVNCRELLAVINKRICVLLDREHQIGHSYLIGISDIAELARAFQHRIIPLLQEYFYDDWERICLVLNKNAFIRAHKADENLFDGTEAVDADRLFYELLDAKHAGWMAPDNYRKIYANTQPQPDDGDD